MPAYFKDGNMIEGVSTINVGSGDSFNILKSTQKRLYVTGTYAGAQPAFIINLPNATTLSLYQTYTLENTQSSIPVTVRDFAGNVLVTFSGVRSLTFTTHSIALSVGDWKQQSGGQGATGTVGLTGVQGQTGVAGINGATGVAGINGATGVAGINGATGIQGVTGSQGMQGSQGVTGNQGVTGLIGPTGFQGVTGLVGVTGVVGLQGPAGVTGLIGVTGFQGPTGYGVQGVTGASLPDTITGKTGSIAIVNAATTVTITFGSPMASADYQVMWSIRNTVDALPMFQPGTITAQTANGFTVSFNAAWDSANYVFHYIAAN